MKVFIVISYTRGIHGVRSTWDKAVQLKKEVDLDLGMSGSLYISYIEEYIVD